MNEHGARANPADPALSSLVHEAFIRNMHLTGAAQRAGAGAGGRNQAEAFVRYVRPDRRAVRSGITCRPDPTPPAHVGGR